MSTSRSTNLWGRAWNRRQKASAELNFTNGASTIAHNASSERQESRCGLLRDSPTEASDMHWIIAAVLMIEINPADIRQRYCKRHGNFAGSV